MTLILKAVFSAVIIVTVAELAKRFTWFAAIVASLPLISILALTWLYLDTKDIPKIIDLSTGIFWAVLPSLLFFIVLPVLLKNGVNFPLAMTISIIVMAIAYAVYVALLGTFGIKF